MKKFRVSINGSNLLMENSGQEIAMGFYTTRWLEAKNLEKAELVALELIRSDHELKKAILNKKDNPPMLYIEEIVELESFESVDPPGTGYTFYPRGRIKKVDQTLHQTQKRCFWGNKKLP